MPFEVWIPPYFSPSSSLPPEIGKTANALDQILCYPLKYGVHQGSSPTSGLPMRSESQSRTLPPSQFPDSLCSTRQLLLTHRMLKVRVAGDLGPSLFPHCLHLFFKIPFLRNLAFLYSPFQRIQASLPHHLCDLNSQEMTLVYIVWLYISSSISFLSNWKTSACLSHLLHYSFLYMCPIFLYS